MLEVRGLSRTGTMRDAAAIVLDDVSFTVRSGEGEVWARYKSHPGLFCTVQDDDFIAAFRELSHSFDDAWGDQ